mmetsp:Transcript_29712/g.61305  ORF Transcript_29712/g.61305 Transcript_29712/m.61305 type:complete len:298 (-) Transcript_29712:190-1083(-)
MEHPSNDLLRTTAHVFGSPADGQLHDIHLIFGPSLRLLSRGLTPPVCHHCAQQVLVFAFVVLLHHTADVVDVSGLELLKFFLGRLKLGLIARCQVAFSLTSQGSAQPASPGGLEHHLLAGTNEPSQRVYCLDTTSPWQLVQLRLHHQQPLVGFFSDLRRVVQSVQALCHVGAPCLLAANGFGHFASGLENCTFQGLLSKGCTSLLFHHCLDGVGLFTFNCGPHPRSCGHHHQQFQGEMLETIAQAFRHAVHNFIDHHLFLCLDKLADLFRAEADAVHGQHMQGHFQDLSTIHGLAQG